MPTPIDWQTHAQETLARHRAAFQPRPPGALELAARPTNDEDAAIATILRKAREHGPESLSYVERQRLARHMQPPRTLADEARERGLG